MREIKFRGKRVDDGEWVYGSLHIQYGEMSNGTRLIEYRILGMNGQIDYIIPETVEQYTGLKDKNGREIYEGDICGCFCNTQLFEVKYCSERCGYFFDDCILSGGCEPAPECLGNLENTIEVIGNIHDNPEVLNEEENKQ